MTWTAVMPLKLGPQRKTRLSDRLSGAQRATLSDHMAEHVLRCLSNCPSIYRIILLSPEHPEWADAAEWRRDAGRGLNTELSALAQDIVGPLLALHADMPLLQVGEVEDLLAQAKANGAAIAPDRHGTGTNALALTQPAGFAYAFGEESFSRHRLLLGKAAIVRQDGLATDIDTPEDLDAAIASGFSPAI